MKKITAPLLALLLVITLIGTATAGAPADLKVNVRNSSGGTVSLRLTDANGNNRFLTIEPGLAPITVVEGEYSYYASLPCGNLAGTWNVNVTKTLFLSCKNEVAFMSLSKVINGCHYFGTWDVDFQYHLEGGSDTDIEPDFLIGPGAEVDNERAFSHSICLDPYLSELYSWPYWQINYVDEYGDWFVIDEDPNH